MRNQKTTRRKTPVGAAWYWMAGAIVLAGMFAARVLPHRSAANTEFPFPCLAHETLALHVHPYLRIMIEGRPVEIPTAIGIRDPRVDRGPAAGGSCFDPLLTHHTPPLIPSEGPDPNRQYTLAEFLAVWSAAYPPTAV